MSYPALLPPQPVLSEYQRGLEAARADAKQGWARCWIRATQLAEDAVYSCLGLSAEQLGYAAGLDEAFPDGVLVLPTDSQLEPPAVAVATVKAGEKPAGSKLATRGQRGKSRAYSTGLKSFRELKKRLCLARFV